MNVIFRKAENETGRAGRNEMAVRAAPEANRECIAKFTTFTIKLIIN